jgi:hypothetical protein
MSGRRRLIAPLEPPPKRLPDASELPIPPESSEVLRIWENESLRLVPDAAVWLWRGVYALLSGLISRFVLGAVISTRVYAKAPKFLVK